MQLCADKNDIFLVILTSLYPFFAAMVLRKSVASWNVPPLQLEIADAHTMKWKISIKYILSISGQSFCINQSSIYLLYGTTINLGVY